MVATSSRPPGVGVMRVFRTSSMTPTDIPLSSATRSRSAGSNSISPRIARSVIFATRAFRPAKSASSSMHSWPIMVESMSASRSFLRRKARGCTTISIGRSPRPSRRRGRRDCRSRWRRETFDVGSRGDNSKAVLIAGPTASGKSALALELARAAGGVIVNADSMQVYRDLRISTARPTPEQGALIPHRLYGHVDAAVNFSAGHWVSDAAKALAQARAQRALPIFVGGSGLYFKALTRGLPAVPPIAPEIREGVRARLDRDGVEVLHAGLARGDPASAERLKPRDRTRIARALEVIEATGRSLTSWHRDGLPPLLPPGSFSALFLAPDRDQLYARTDARFEAMLQAGAPEEVA